MKKFLAQKRCETCPMENVGGRKITQKVKYQKKISYLSELLVFDGWIIKASVKPVNNYPKSEWKRS